MSASKSVRIGIIGPGIMGGTMARALLAAGHRGFGYDVDMARLRALRRAGGTPMPGYAELVSQADALITSLPSAQALHEVVAGLLDTKPRKRGQVLLETSTLPLSDKKQADNSLRSQGRVMLDAPISGTATIAPHWPGSCTSAARPRPAARFGPGCRTSLSTPRASAPQAAAASSSSQPTTTSPSAMWHAPKWSPSAARWNSIRASPCGT